MVVKAVDDPAGRRWSPLVMATGYTAITLGLYLWGPLPWAKDNLFNVVTIIVSTGFAFTFGYVASAGRPVTLEAPLRRVTSIRIIVWGAGLNVLTLPIAIYGYTGSSITDVSFSLARQGEVYLTRYQYLIDEPTSVARTSAAVSRSVVAPLVAGGLALLAFHWPTLSIRVRALGLTSVAAQLVYSLSRGTDKEVIDLLIVIAAVAIVRGSKTFLKMVLRLTVLCLVIVLVFGLFTSRREARLGDRLSRCQLNAGICAESPSTSPIAETVGVENYFGLVSLTSYVTQGYHGLDLAVDGVFPAMYGVGNNAALTRLVETVGGTDIDSSSYQNQLLSDGWDPRHSWSSGYAWFANDISFFLLPVLWYFLGWFFQSSFRAARDRASDRGFVVFWYLVLLIIYMPANNQIGTSLDSTVAFGVWFSSWVVHRYRVRRVSGSRRARDGGELRSGAGRGVLLAEQDGG